MSQMKYVIVIPDGCADEPQDALGGKTPLQAAELPNMDRIAQLGVVGLANNVPATLTPASDVATLSLFGYDPLQVYTGRAPLETVAMNVALGPNDWAIRCNLVYTENDEMRDFTAGHIASDDSRALIAALNTALGGPVPGGRLEFHAGVSYRHILVFRAASTAPFMLATKTQPPHDIPDRPIAHHLPQGPGSALLIELMNRSRDVLRDHPVNAQRRAAGARPATQIWLWGQGKMPTVRPYRELYGPRGAIISAVDLVRGVGQLIGWSRIDVPGATGYLDTDYVAKGWHAVAALAEHDLVCVHVEAPDEASHEGRIDEKVKALQCIDQHIVGPLFAALPAHGAWRILVEPDHRTTVRTRAHAHGPVAFAAAGTGIQPGQFPAYDETVAAESSLRFDPGWHLMRWFIG